MKIATPNLIPCSFCLYQKGWGGTTITPIHRNILEKWTKRCNQKEEEETQIGERKNREIRYTHQLPGPLKTLTCIRIAFRGPGFKHAKRESQNRLDGG